MHNVLSSASARQTRNWQGPRVTTLALLLAAMHAPARASAQEATPEAPPAESSDHLEDAGCVKTEEVSQNTNELFHRALAAWEGGDTNSAVGLLREAHAISSCSVFLFILGELQREQHNDCDALAWYEEYLKDNPNGQKGALAAQRIVELRARCTSVPQLPKATQPLPAPPSTPLNVEAHRESPPGPRYWTAARVGGWSSIGVSAVLAAGAVFYAVRAENAESEYEQLWAAAPGDPARSVDWQQQHSHLEQRGPASATTARILGGTAAALAVGGTLLVVLNPGAKPSPTQDVAVSVQPQAVNASYSLRF